jgi:hypothetical protein
MPDTWHPLRQFYWHPERHTLLRLEEPIAALEDSSWLLPQTSYNIDCALGPLYFIRACSI